MAFKKRGKKDKLLSGVLLDIKVLREAEFDKFIKTDKERKKELAKLKKKYGIREKKG